MYWMLDWFHHPPARLAWIWKKHDETIYLLCCYFGRLPKLFRPFRLSSLRKSDAFIGGFWFGFLGNTFPPKPPHWWDDSLMTFLSKGPKYWIYLGKLAYSTLCFFWKKHTRAHWYPSHLRMKDQGRKLICENDKLQRFLCLLVLLLDTYLVEIPFLHVIKKIAVRPSKVQQPQKYTLHVLTSILESWVAFDVRDTNKCHWPDLPKQPDCNSLINSFKSRYVRKASLSNITDQGKRLC